MKISKDTLEILQSFAAINPNLVIKPGSVIQTISESNTILGVATTEETWPAEIGIYNLGEFNSTLGLFKDPDIEFGETTLKIKEGRLGVNYQYADPSILTSPKQDIKLPTPLAVIALSASDIATLKKASSAFGLGTLVIKPKGKKIIASIADPSNPKSNSVDLEVGDNLDESSFEIHIATLNLKIIPGDYSLELAKGISCWTHQSRDVKYFIALEKSSKFA